jgi:hypothetical protein
MKCTYWFLMLAAITFVFENANEITGVFDELAAAPSEPAAHTTRKKFEDKKDVTIH